MFTRPRNVHRAGLSKGRFHFAAACLGMGLFAGVLLTAAAPAVRADAQAQDILKKMAALYAVKTFQGKANMNLKGITEDKKPYDVSGVQEVTYKSPNLFLIKATGTAVGGGTQIRVFDGKNNIVYGSGQNKYMKQAVPEQAIGKINIPMLTLFGVNYDPQSGKVLNTTTIGGKPAYVVQVMPPVPMLKPPPPPFGKDQLKEYNKKLNAAKTQLEEYKKTLQPFEMVIDKQDYRLLRVTQTTPAFKMTKTLDITQQTLNPNLADNVFVFTPPPGATEIKPDIRKGMKDFPHGLGNVPGAGGNANAGASRGGGNPLPPPHASPSGGKGSTH